MIKCILIIKNDTNIDNDFNNKQNVLSSILSVISKYKKVNESKYTFKVSNKKRMSKEKVIEVKNIDKTVPTGSCIGSYKDENSYNYMIKGFVSNFGQENLTIFNTSHGNVPRKTLTEDKNNDNRSDLIEWMLTQQKNA